MKKRQFIADYLTFSRRDRIAVLVLVFLILIILFLPRWFGYNNTNSDLKVDSTLLLAIDSVSKQQQQATAASTGHFRPESKAAPTLTGALSNFDPNTLSEEGWLRMGLPERTARTISHYLAKGGHFRRPEDLKRIWGL